MKNYKCSEGIEKFMKLGKIIKRAILSVIGLILLISIGLIINNRIYYVKYSNKDTSLDYLTSDEIAQVQKVYSYLGQKGNDIMNGFDGESTDLIIYNEKYEFLLCHEEKSSEWEYIGYNSEIGKNIYRRVADNSQAFAVKVDDRWV